MKLVTHEVGRGSEPRGLSHENSFSWKMVSLAQWCNKKIQYFFKILLTNKTSYGIITSVGERNLLTDTKMEA